MQYIFFHIVHTVHLYGKHVYALVSQLSAIQSKCHNFEEPYNLVKIHKNNK